MNFERITRRACWLAAACLLAACGENAAAPGPDRGPPGLRIVSGAPLSDTVDAVAGPLFVELRDSAGLPLANRAVTFTAVEPAPGATPYVLVSGDAQSAPQRTFGSLTNAEGRSAVYVRMGRTAGPGSVRVEAPGLAAPVTAGYTVQPGALVRLEVSPADTVLYVGSAYALRPPGRDRHGNVRSDPATYTAGPNAISVEGTSVRGAAIGRGRVEAAIGGLRATGQVSVVPRGVIGAWKTQNLLDAAAMVVMELDGSSMRRVIDTRESHPQTPVQGSWTADAGTLVYGDTETSSGGGWRLYRVATAGERTLFAPNARVLAQYAPTISPDQQWVYYTGAARALAYTLWRVRADGTGAEEIDTEQTAYSYMPEASVSPDGSRVVWAPNGHSGPHIRVVDTATRRATVLPVQGLTPRWAKHADWIAFTSMSGNLHVMRPDGTGERQVTNPSNGTYRPGPQWSPDGKYLIAISSQRGRPELITVETGEVLPLPYRDLLLFPVWIR